MSERGMFDIVQSAVLVLIIFWSHGIQADSKVTQLSTPAQPTPTILKATPIINISQNRAPPGKSFKIDIEFTQKPASRPAIEVRFDAGENKTPARIQSIRHTNETEWEVIVRVPEEDSIFKGMDKPWYRNILSRTATLFVKIGDNEFSRDFGVPRESVALGWGLATMVFLLSLAALWGPKAFKEDRRFTEDVREERWKSGHKPISRLFRYVLNFAVSHRGRYSVSTTQILFWTGLVIFASVYVFIVRGDFLTVTNQILILLGVSGGTAIAAKMNVQTGPKDWIPLDYFEGLRRTRLPSLRDLISAEDRPNIYKFQMLAFTLINGWVVISQLFAKYNFPEIPTEQLLLIGISNGTYLGNELSAYNKYEYILSAKDEAEKKRGTNEFEAARTEVQCLICDYYGAEKILPSQSQPAKSEPDLSEPQKEDGGGSL